MNTKTQQAQQAFDAYCKTLNPLWNTVTSRTYAEEFFHAGFQAALEQPAQGAQQYRGELQARIETLEDLLLSAGAIATRKGEGTHWERFKNELRANGIGNITARTFRILPSDEDYTHPSPAFVQEPKGYKLVPVNLTEEMLDAADAAGDCHYIATQWKMMLKAAPKPPAREWVSLSEDEIDYMWEILGDVKKFAHAIEQALKAKNDR